MTLFSGLEDWNDDDVLTQVLAASRQEYLDSLKKAKENESKSRRSSSDSIGNDHRSASGSSSGKNAT